MVCFFGRKVSFIPKMAVIAVLCDTIQRRIYDTTLCTYKPIKTITSAKASQIDITIRSINMEMTVESNELKFAKEFKVGNVIGKGAFGQVIEAIHQPTGQIVAIKFGDDSLKKEHRIYELLKVRDATSDDRVPKIYGFGCVFDTNWLAMDLLGPSLDKLLEKCGSLSTQTVLMMGIQMVECLEYLHERQIIHGDIKGDNFAISAQDPHKIVIFDFGLAHKKNDFTETFHGSLVYASIATHKFETICVHDDFESLGYLLADFRKDLPWKKLDWPAGIMAQIKFGRRQ